MKISRPLFCILVAFVAMYYPARADTQGQMTRALVGKYSPSVVTLQLVLKSAAAGGQQAQLEADGIVIDPSGLVATTNTAIDPTSMYASMMSEEDAGSLSTSVVSIKIRLASGEELPARVVLRDKDRNLAIIRPLSRPAKPLVAVNFKGASSAQLGDSIYILGRLGKAGSRQPALTSQRVTSVVEKPRRFYVLDASAYAYLGNVVFNESGQPLGLLSIHVTGGGRSLSSSDAFLAIVIPTTDVWEVALQAPQANAVHAPRHTAPAKPAAPKAAATERAKAKG